MLSDPLRLQAGTFAKRRRLHGHRLWLRAVAAVRGTEEPPARPIFIIGCPRSGTTLLFRLLRSHEALGSPHGEGHVLWNTWHHPRRTGWSSDRVTAADIAPGERRYVYTGVQRLSGGARFLDKTPRNSLRVPYLAALFPDARFVLLKRNGPETVSSLIEGWTVRHGVSYRLPEPLRLQEYHGRFWSYVLPEGWRRWADTSVAEVAAFQYAASYETALDDFASRPELPCAEVVFEDLLERPRQEAERLLDALELPRSERVMDMAANLGAHPVQTNSPPRPEKWRDRADQIARVLPHMAPTMARLGYDARVQI
ncbi:sulfotransferase [soil metagenome]